MVILNRNRQRNVFETKFCDKKTLHLLSSFRSSVTLTVQGGLRPPSLTLFGRLLEAIDQKTFHMSLFSSSYRDDQNELSGLEK